MSLITTSTATASQTTVTESSSQRVTRWLTVAALTFGLGQSVRFFQHQGLNYFLPSLMLAPGCLLPVFLRWGIRSWTAVICGALLTLLFLPGIRDVGAQSSWISIPTIAVGFAVEMWLTSRLLQRWSFRIDLSRGKDALLLIYAALIGTAISGWVVMPLVYWPEALTAWKFVETCGTWWLMNFVSIVVFAPAWLVMDRRITERSSDAPWLIVCCVITLVCTGIGFELWTPLPGLPNPLVFLGVPLCILAPLICGARGAAVVTVLTCLTAAHATAEGVGPFAKPDAIDANLGLNLFLISLGLTTYAVGGFVSERREVQDRLEIGHALLEKAEEIAGVGSWQYHAVTLAEHWSDQFFRLLGLLPNEITPDVKVFQQRFVIEEDRQRFHDDWLSFVRTGQPNRIEIRVRRTDGQVRIVVGQAEVQRDYRGQPVRFVGTLRDVTERRQAMEERQRMQELLNKAEELANLGSWEMDGTGFMPRWSDNMHRICGIERGDFDGPFETFLQRFVHPDDRERVWSTFQQFAAGNGPDWCDFRILRGDGEIRHVHLHVQVARRENGQLVRCFGTTTDVTDRKHAEQQLMESEQRYRMLADHSSDMIARLRGDGTIDYISPACRKILGYEPGELCHRTALELIAPSHQDQCRDMIQGLLAGEDRHSVPYRGLRKDQTEVWLETKAQLLVDDTGRRELLCVTRDITERRILEEQVAQAQRLEAIGRLAGGIAHDFNNILTVINGYAEILESRFPPEDSAAKYVASILEAGRRAALLTRQLLTYSRRQMVTRGQINLNDVIRKMEPLLRPLMGEDIEPVFRLDPEIGMIEGDVSQFEQLLMNLAINARDAMPEGGFLTMQTERVFFAAWEIRPRNIAPGRFVKLVVADTGEGMDELVRARLFEPFFTTKGVGEGTGLGLATVYATVEQSGGAIQVESAVGEGTRFEIYLPCHDASPAINPAVEPLPVQPAAAVVQRRILVVEDDPDVRLLVEQALQDAGHVVVSAGGGDDALTAATPDAHFDLLLTDVVMKGLNGRELADRLRLQYPHLPVIFMSGHTDDLVLRRGVLNDELTFLQKPFTASQLIQRVQQVFTERTT